MCNSVLSVLYGQETFNLGTYATILVLVGFAQRTSTMSNTFGPFNAWNLISFSNINWSQVSKAKLILYENIVNTIPRIQIGHYEEFPLSKGTTSTFCQKGQFGSSLEGIYVDKLSWA